MGRKFPDDWIEAKMRVALSKKEIIELDIKSAYNEYFIMEDGSELYYKDCEWLDESAPAQQVFTWEQVEAMLKDAIRHFNGINGLPEANQGYINKWIETTIATPIIHD